MLLVSHQNAVKESRVQLPIRILNFRTCRIKYKLQKRQLTSDDKGFPNRAIALSVPYEHLIFIGTFILFIGSALVFLYNKLTLASAAILNLQKQSDSLNSLLNQLSTKNNTLVSMLSDLNIKNQYLDKVLQEMQAENSMLLHTISDLKTNLALLEKNSHIINSSSVDPNTLLLLALGVVVTLGAVTYGSYSLVTLVGTHYPNSSLGLLLSGIDKHLIWLGEKTKIIQRIDIERTLIDKFSNSYRIDSKGDEIVNLLFDNNGTFVDMGVYLNTLLTTIDKHQTTIDLLKTQISTITPSTTFDTLAVVTGNVANHEVISTLATNAALFSHV